MARTRSISDAQILEAARAMFLKKGYSATTAEIARRAGISEGTIFRRYATKDELFLAAMGLDDDPEWFALCSARVGQGDVRDNLRCIVEAVHDFFVDQIPRMIGVIGSPIDFTALLRRAENPTPLRGHRTLAGWIAAEADLGRLPRPRNVDVVARIILGTIHLHAFSGRIGLNERLGLSNDALLDGLVDLVLQTLEVSAAAAADTNDDDRPTAARRDATGEERG